MNTKDARSLPSAAQEELRRKAVEAVLEGKKQTEVARIFGVTRHAVGKWVRAYRRGGAEALKARKRGRPKGGWLAPWQAAQTARVVLDRHPEQLKLPFCLWTREAVAQLIERRFGIRLSLWTVGRYLKRWGFVQREPMRLAFDRNSEAVRQWLEKDYPAIRQQARREKARIYWGYETGLRLDDAAHRSRGRYARGSAIRGAGARFGCRMLSAITNRGRLSFMVCRERFRASVFLQFLKWLVRQAEGKVFIIVDGHPVHRSRKVRDWLNKNTHHIRQFFLPTLQPGAGSG